MIFIPVVGNSETIRVCLKTSYPASEIGLLDFTMPASRNAALIEIVCDQVDSSLENPKRLIKVFKQL
mgnify:CR=1 FL=1|jgi:hypothetical protein